MASPVPPPWLVQPLDPADFDPPGSLPDPGFTQLVNDTLGNVGTSADGFDGIITEVFGLLNALDAASAEQDAVLDAILAQQQPLDTSSLDTSMQGYLGTIDTGNGFVSDAQALAPPQLLEFPINPDFSGGAVAPPKLSGVDFGTVTLGSPAISHLLGTSSPTKTGRTGIENVALVDGDPSIFSLKVVQSPPIPFTTRDGGHYIDYAYTYFLVMTPAVAGQFTAQVNSGTVPFAGFNIITFTVNVVP